MINIEKVETWGFEHAVRGMRNPLNSWSKSDSGYRADGEHYDYVKYVIGDEDMKLMRKLYKAGSEHRKYLRQVFVSMDITSNHFWWAQFDTYHIGITRDSCSKMHRIHIKEFAKEDFSTEGIDECGGMTLQVFMEVLDELEWLRKEFNKTHEKKYWRAILELLPMGYNIKATVTMDYENVVSIIRQRASHKLEEWHKFVDVLMGLPYVAEITQIERPMEARAHE